MKILYITPSIIGNGGVEKILSVKTKFLIENYGYEICILTQDKKSKVPFFDFHSKVEIKNVTISNTFLFRIINYYKLIKKQIQSINPDIIVICASGWKSYLFKQFVKTKQPIVLEIHNSIHYKSIFDINLFFKDSIRNYFIRKALSAFENIVFLSENNREEYRVRGTVISNPITFQDEVISDLQNKKVLCVARHSYEKGIDRILHIWKKIAVIAPHWKLDIYGDGEEFEKNYTLATDLNILDKVSFYEPIKNINDKYQEASIYVMTSRYEAQPLTLLEATHFGLPIVAYDCPDGPRTIIEDNESGYLIPNGNEVLFVEKLIGLINNIELRQQMGILARANSKKYNIIEIMNQWDFYFNKILKH